MPDEPPGQDLPTGTITFVLTDVEGSTGLWELVPAAMGEAMARHDALIGQAVVQNGGSLVRPRGEGDSRFAVFARAHDAVSGARDIQLAFAAQSWPTPTPLHVRIALYTGEADLRAGDYYGSDVNRCARLRAIAHGGQTLLSQTTFGLVCDSLPQNVTLRDLGEHRLKDLQRSEHIYQLLIAGLPSDFPPLLSLSAFRNNLPAQVTSFIGRERELAEVRYLLSSTRLLTLTGPGGTGKTRLALQLGTEVLEEFADGVWLAELAPLASPDLLAQTVAAPLGVREQPGRSALQALTDYIRAKTMLLILDNCEHLIEASAQIANGLLRAAPGLKILATSRESLGIAGETSYRVPSLPLPEPRQMEDIDALALNDCVRLFVDRALAVSPSFRLKEKNAAAIADICRRLDGIPLAIELASARTKVLPPEEIAARLDDRFRLLTGGSRTALERHQTLFALIEWSHNLLSEPERVLLRRLSVFAGGWSFEAAEDVCGDGLGDEVLDLLTHLVDKSLVGVEESAGEARYRLPETIRQYARDKLFESGEAERVRDRHLEFFLRFGERAEPKLRSAEQLDWLERLETEYDNLRTALAWSLESGKSNHALELAGALGFFWQLHGLSEGAKWLNEALALAERELNDKVASGAYVPTDDEVAHRAKALYAAGLFQIVTMDVQKARTMVEESVRLWRDLGDNWWTAVALERVGLFSEFQGDMQTALACLEEGVSLARVVEDPWPLAVCLVRLGDALRVTDAVAARPLLEEGVTLARTVGDKGVLSEGLRKLGSLYYLEGDLTKAAQVTEEAVAEARAIRSLLSVFLALGQLVTISCLQKDPARAKGYSLELWAIGKDTGSPFAALLALISFGLVATFAGEPGRGVRLFAALEVHFGQQGMAPPSGDPLMIVMRQTLERAQAQLGPAAFEAAQREGRALTLEQAIALAIGNQGNEQRYTGLQNPEQVGDET